jgi:hypothetical protein
MVATERDPFRPEEWRGGKTSSTSTEGRQGNPGFCVVLTMPVRVRSTVTGSSIHHVDDVLDDSSS